MTVTRVNIQKGNVFKKGILLSQSTLKFKSASNRWIDRSLVKVQGIESTSKFNSVKSSIKLRLNNENVCKLFKVAYDITIKICKEPAFVYAEIS